jgi:hypothetical protein
MTKHIPGFADRFEKHTENVIKQMRENLKNYERRHKNKQAD